MVQTAGGLRPAKNRRRWREKHHKGWRMNGCLKNKTQAVTSLLHMFKQKLLYVFRFSENLNAIHLWSSPCLNNISQNLADFPQIIKGEIAVFKWLIMLNKKKGKKSLNLCPKIYWGNIVTHTLQKTKNAHKVDVEKCQSLFRSNKQHAVVTSFIGHFF